jgi:hypothetical protein
MLSAIQNEKANPGNIAMHEATLRQVKTFDAYMKAVDALHNNNGLSNDTWATVLSTYCPDVNRYGYKVGDEEPLGATKEICEDNKNKPFWKGANH